jgi:hypothetical protein
MGKIMNGKPRTHKGDENNREQDESQINDFDADGIGIE